jgi:glyoxylase-like metal-dependent hydrolase (beta-lactamase superfamily II)
MQLWSIEGNRQHLDGGSMFGNAPRALWQRWHKADENHRIELATRCLLAKDLLNRNVLFEAGMGAFLSPKLADRFGLNETDHRLLLSLDAAGISHEDIDAVVLSHLHFDHCGGLFSPYETDKPMRLLFPNARFFISEAAWHTANSPHIRDKPSFIPQQIQLLTESARVELVGGARHPYFADAVQFEFSNGHTQGLMLAELHGKQRISFASDLIPGTTWVKPNITMGYDRFPELAIDEKLAYLNDKVARNVSIFYTHDPAYAISNVAQDKDGNYVSCNEVAAIENFAL